MELESGQEPSNTANHFTRMRQHETWCSRLLAANQNEKLVEYEGSKEEMHF